MLLTDHEDDAVRFLQCLQRGAAGAAAGAAAAAAAAPQTEQCRALPDQLQAGLQPDYAK